MITNNNEPQSTNTTATITASTHTITTNTTITTDSTVISSSDNVATPTAVQITSSQRKNSSGVYMYVCMYA